MTRTCGLLIVMLFTAGSASAAGAPTTDFVLFSNWGCVAPVAGSYGSPVGDLTLWKCFSVSDKGAVTILPLELPNPGGDLSNLKRVGQPGNINWLCSEWDDRTSDAAQLNCVNPVGRNKARLQHSFPRYSTDAITEWLKVQLGSDVETSSLRDNGFLLGQNERRAATPSGVQDAFAVPGFWKVPTQWPAVTFGRTLCNIDEFDAVYCRESEKAGNTAPVRRHIPGLSRPLSVGEQWSSVWLRSGVLRDVGPSPEWRGIFHLLEKFDAWGLEMDPRHPRGVAFRARNREVIQFLGQYPVPLELTFVNQSPNRARSSLLKLDPGLEKLQHLAQVFALGEGAETAVTDERVRGEVSLELAWLRFSGKPFTAVTSEFALLVKSLNLSPTTANGSLLLNVRITRPFDLLLITGSRPTSVLNRIEDARRALVILTTDFFTLVPEQRQRIGSDLAAFNREFKNDFAEWAKEPTLGSAFAMMAQALVELETKGTF